MPFSSKRVVANSLLPHLLEATRLKSLVEMLRLTVIPSLLNPMAHKSSTNNQEKKFSQSSNGEIATTSTPSSKFGSFLMAALSKLSQHPPLKEIIVDSVEPTTETRKMNLLWRLLLQKWSKNTNGVVSYYLH